MLFKTHPENIRQIKAVIRKWQVCWFHGDGNMYTNEVQSNDASIFFNPKQEECGYRKKFTSVDQVPDTVEELNKVLSEAHIQEMKEKREKATRLVELDNVFKVDDDDDVEEKPKNKGGRPKKVQDQEAAE